MNAAASFLSNGGDVIIRMRGLPYSATSKDIVSNLPNLFFVSLPPLRLTCVLLEPNGLTLNLQWDDRLY